MFGVSHNGPFGEVSWSLPSSVKTETDEGTYVDHFIHIKRFNAQGDVSEETVPVGTIFYPRPPKAPWWRRFFS